MTSKEEMYKTIENHYRANFNTTVKKFSNAAGSSHDAAEMVQEAYTRALHYWTSFDAARSGFEQWFGGILKNTLADKRKEHRNHGMVNEVQREPVANVHFYKKLLSEIDILIDSKPPHLAYVLRLFFLEQYTPAEITELVPYANGTIRNWIFEFKRELKEKYNGGID